MTATPIPVTDDELAALHARLEAAAESSGAIDVGYRVVDSPLGSLLLAATEEGLVRIAYAREDHDAVLDALGREVSPRILRSPGRLDGAARELDEYFAHRRTAFDLPVDLRLVRGFRRSVVEKLPSIAYGSTESYGWIADAAGNARAVRAAGSACAHNPIPIVVPCHRVVRSDGTIGQYLGGPAAKLALLELEGAR